MRKMLLLAAVVLATSSATGCNCFRNSCGGGGRGGLFGFGLLGNRQPAYAAAPVCCPPPVICCDPCAGAEVTSGTIVGSPMVSDGGSCCN